MGAVQDLVKEALQHSRSGEQILAAMKSTRDVASRLEEIALSDPELEPELNAAGQRLVEAAEAMARASDFTNARLEVRMKEITDNL
jgi:hypothetical protein